MNSIENGQWVINVAYLLLFVAAFLLARMLLQEEESRAAQENLEDGKARPSSNALIKYTRPFFNQYVTPSIRGKPRWEESRKKFKRKIVSAGLRDEITPDEFIAFKVSLIVVFPLICGLLRALDMLSLEWYWILASGLAGWFYPDFMVSQRITKRHDQVLKSLPFIVDLLALSTEAGLDFVGAIGKVVDKAKSSPLVDELGQVLKEIKVGSSRSEALREMAVRLNMTEINSFVSILISAEQMGASIGKILRQQSEQIRTERMLRAEKAGAAAAQKLMIPIIFVILPAVFIMIAGPFVVGALYGG